MEPLKKAVENRKAPFEIEGKAGGRVISLRVSERMEQLLEEQAQEWNMSISDTLRSILNFYFLPPLLLEAWEKKVQALIELDTQQTGKNRADMNAPTQAQRIEPVLVDSEEAEEYAKFINELWDKNVKYWETLRVEALSMSKIALKRLTETVEALRKAREQLKEAEVEQ
jgi:hypothetical protein